MTEKPNPEATRKGLENMTKARARLIYQSAFYGPLVAKYPCTPVDDLPGLPFKLRMATDGKQIFFSPGWAATQSIEALKGVIVHEVLHIIYLHFARFKRLPKMPRKPLEDMDPEERAAANAVMQKANKAADYTINQNVLDDGFTLPEDCLLDNKYKGSMEDIYSRLPDDDGSGGGGGGGEGIGGVIMGQPMTEEEEGELIKEIQGSVQAAATAARMAGKVPGHIKALLDEWGDATVDWRTRLWQFDTAYGGIHTRTTWAKPNRRYIAHGMYLPRKLTYGPKCIVTALDTSGSVSDPEIKALMAEISGIHQSCAPAELIVIQFDHVIQDVTHFKPDDIIDPASFTIKGRGGTTFKQVFDYVSENVLDRVTPDYLIFGTDGYDAFPAKPDYPVIWAMTTDVKAPWGENIRLTAD